MSELRHELKRGCALLLDDMIVDGTNALEKVAANGVDAVTLAKLIGNKRTDTLRDSALRKMADSAENQLLARWTDQQELEV